MRQKIITFIVFTSLLSAVLFFVPNTSFANGGDQRVVEGKYLVNLSRSPFTPKAGDDVAMIASFFDIQEDKLIAEDLIVKVRIAKLGEERGKREFLFERENLITKGGILEFQYAFTKQGLHEIFFDFAFSSNPQKIYKAPDFLLDIQKSSVQETSSLNLYLGIALGVIVGFIGGWFIKRA